MKKNLSILLANITEVGLFSCQDVSRNNQEEVSGKATYISAGLWPVTYTIAPEMKYLKSVAFFVETENGKFHKFLSTEPLKSRLGFEELVKTDNNYTGVTIKLKDGHQGKNKITVVGNYKENNLTEALKSARCMEDILKLMLRSRTSGSEYPLLMFDHKTVEIS